MLDTDFLQILACPWDHTDLEASSSELVCLRGHHFLIEGGVPILTDRPRRGAVPANMGPCRFSDPDSSVDSFVNDWIVNSNGNLYKAARGRLRRYPIPNWPVSAKEGMIVVDIGCGWGRWSVAASRAGLRPIGVDAHLDALLAAVRVSRQLGVHANFVCAEANHLPVKPASADAVFSYSVLQHIDRAKLPGVFQEASRVLKPDGTCLVQLPNRWGPLSLLRQARRGFRDGRPGTSEMRYWSGTEIRTLVDGAAMRLVSIRADGFFSQDPQLSDLDLLPFWGKMVVLTSHAGCRLTSAVPVLKRFADSLWVEAQAPAARPAEP